MGVRSYSGHQSLDNIDTTDYPSRRPSISLSDFLPSANEQNSILHLHEGVFQCMLLKQVQFNHVLPGIPSLLNCIQEQRDKEVSTVVYVQIISEKADSKDTLIKVVGNIYQTFVIQLG